MNRERGLAFGKDEDVEHAHRITMEVVTETIRLTGDIRSASVRFIDKNEVELYALPVLLSPLNTFGDSTMLLINKLTEIDERIEYVSLISTLQMHGGELNNKRIIASHFENRSSPNITTDLLYNMSDRKKITQCSISFYNELRSHGLDDIFPFFGFFHHSQKQISSKTWNYINENLFKIITFSSQKNHTERTQKEKEKIKLLFENNYLLLNELCTNVTYQ